MEITDKNIFSEAKKGNLDVLKHPSVDKIVNRFGNTPLHFLAWEGKVPREWIIEKYLWFALGERKITSKIITEILNTSYAERFINSL